jgi:hypothetical protein
MCKVGGDTYSPVACVTNSLRIGWKCLSDDCHFAIALFLNFQRGRQSYNTCAQSHGCKLAILMQVGGFHDSPAPTTTICLFSTPSGDDMIGYDTAINWGKSEDRRASRDRTSAATCRLLGLFKHVAVALKARSCDIVGQSGECHMQGWIGRYIPQQV